MQFFSTILRLLALLALANLVLTPLVAPATAMMRATPQVAVDDVMPCCPRGEPMPADCGGCIGMTFCIAKSMPAVSDWHDNPLAQLPQSNVIHSCGDVMNGGIGLRPPKPPPRA